jgi:hypothetical protein
MTPEQLARGDMGAPDICKCNFWWWRKQGMTPPLMNRWRNILYG